MLLIHNLATLARRTHHLFSSSVLSRVHVTGGVVFNSDRDKSSASLCLLVVEETCIHAIRTYTVVCAGKCVISVNVCVCVCVLTGCVIV
jgi:hypothetical protein